MFDLTITTDGAAFEDAPAHEVARILRDLADFIESGTDLNEHPVRDGNGNSVGYVTTTIY